MGQKMANETIPKRIFANPAPSVFSNGQERSVAIHNAPQHVAIMANHVPSELLEAQTMLESQGIEINILGKQGRVEAVTPSALAHYDPIITIGKMVQYCLSTGKPV